MEDVFNKQNLDAAEETIADDVVEHNPLSPDMGNDKKAALETFRAMFAMSPDMKAEEVDIIASGNKVALYSRMTGTDSGIGWGSQMGVGPTGKPYTVEGIDVVTLGDDGKFKEHYGIFDTMGMMGQLGLLPPPPG
jgi:predicted ester cyclase